jgi:hypothetical protein
MEQPDRRQWAGGVVHDHDLDLVGDGRQSSANRTSPRIAAGDDGVDPVFGLTRPFGRHDEHDPLGDRASPLEGPVEHATVAQLFVLLL